MSIVSPEAVEFMKQVYQRCVRGTLAPVAHVARLLEPFTGIKIEDSTVMELNEHLAEKFKGSGGSAHKFSVVVHTIYEARREQLIWANIRDCRTSDRGQADEILNHLEPGDLSMRNLGFFERSSLRKIYGAPTQLAQSIGYAGKLNCFTSAGRVSCTLTA